MRRFAVILAGLGLALSVATANAQTSTPTTVPTSMSGYPATQDTLCDPDSTAPTNGAACPHAELHSSENDAIEALERKTGTGASTPVAGTYLGGTGVGTSAYLTPLPTNTAVPTDTPIPPVPTDTPRATDTPIPAATREAQGFAFSTATPVTGCIESAVSIAQVDCVAPGTAITPAPTATPRATDSPIPIPTAVATCAVGIVVDGSGVAGVACGNVAITTATAPAGTYLYDTLGGAGSVLSYATVLPTATPRLTDTPIPAPTLAPTLAVGELAVGTGGQGLQDGHVAVTTATAPAGVYLFDALGGGGSVLNYATVIPTSTPRATDTPAPTPTLVPASTTKTLLSFTTGTGTVAGGATSFLGVAANSATEANIQIPVASAVTLTAMYVSTSAAPGATSKTVTYTLRKNGVDTTITCITTDPATTSHDIAHSVAFVAGDVIDVKVVAAAGATTAIHSIMLSS